MKYFESYFANSSAKRIPKTSTQSSEEVSIHCDCTIFEWLISYMNNSDDPPELSIDMVLPILIASDFLVMEGVIKFCLSYICNNFYELLLNAKNSLSCIKESLFIKIAHGLTPQNLLKMPKGYAYKLHEYEYIMENIYRAKIEKHFKESKTMKVTSDSNYEEERLPYLIHRCIKCGRLYVDSHGAAISHTCRSTPHHIGYRGDLGGHSCLPDSNLSISNCLAALRIKFKSWSCAYWQLQRIANNASITIKLQNASSGIHRNITQGKYSTKRFCPEKAVFGETHYASVWGIHPCCGRMVVKFDPWDVLQGCVADDISPIYSNNENISEEVDMYKAISKLLNDYSNSTCIYLPSLKNDNSYHGKFKGQSKINIQFDFNILSPSDDLDSSYTISQNRDPSGYHNQNSDEMKLLEQNNDETERRFLPSLEFFVNIPPIECPKRSNDNISSETGFQHFEGKNNFEIFRAQMGLMLCRNRLKSDKHEIQVTKDSLRKSYNYHLNPYCSLEEEHRNAIKSIRSSKIDNVRKVTWMKHIRSEVDSERINAISSRLVHLREKLDICENANSSTLVKPSSCELRKGIWKTTFELGRVQKDC